MTRTANDPALSDRIAEVVRRHGLSAVARATATPHSTVHRYFSGGRVTAGFCAALARAFGLNPQWLVCGDGPMLAEGVKAAGDPTNAVDIVQLLAAMNAVAQVRIGALHARHYARVLRELDDALTRYEALKAKLNSHSTGVLVGLSEGIEAAVSKIDVDRANDLLKAAEQVHRLNDDPAAERRFLLAKSRLAYAQRDIGTSLACETAMMRNALAEGAFTSEADCHNLARLALNLYWAGRPTDAQRAIEAGLILASGHMADWEAYSYLEYIGTRVHMDAGNLRRALELTARWWDDPATHRVPARREHGVQARLLAGLITPRQGVELLGLTDRFIGQVMPAALWSERTADCAWLLRQWRRVELRVPGSATTRDAAALAVRAASRRIDLPRAFAEFNKTRGTHRFDAELALMTLPTLARHGLRTEGKAQLAALRRHLGPNTNLGHLSWAEYHRAVLRLHNGGRQTPTVKAAHEFFERALEAGYELYRPWYEAWNAGEDATRQRVATGRSGGRRCAES